jgi:hypothetical protein
MAGKILLQGSIVRALYGVVALLFPKLLFSLPLGVKEEEVGPEGRYFNRLFGGRDLLVAGATVSAVKAGAARQAVQANLICELTDTISLAEEVRRRGKLDRTLVIGLLFNVTGYATWLRALVALKSKSPEAAEAETAA